MQYFNLIGIEIIRYKNHNLSDMSCVSQQTVWDSARVAKCQFTRSKIVKQNFTPKNLFKGWFWTTTWPKSWASFYTENLHKYFQKRLIWQNCMFSQTFYPKLQKSLHGYILHIRDILQLCDSVWQFYWFGQLGLFKRV